MGKHETITAEISDVMALTIQEAVASGDYDSVTDVVRHALLEWHIAQRMPKISSEQLQALLEEGLTDEDCIDADVFFDQLLSELDEMIAADERAA